MENCNIQLYKDGKDIILVFKNANSELENVISGIIAGLTHIEPVEKTVPCLEEPENPDVPDSLPCVELDEEMSAVPEEFLNNDPAALLDDDFNSNVFSDGPHAGMTPEEIISENGFKGFIYLCRVYMYEKETLIGANTVLLDDIKNSIVNYYIEHNELKAKLAGAFDVKTARGFITNCYIFNSLVYDTVLNGNYSSIEEYIITLSDEEIKTISKALGDTVVMFFEGIR